MSWKVSAWVMEHAPVKSPAEQAILYALADRAHDDGTCAWPSQSWLAKMTMMSDRTVRRHLAALEDRGLIVRGDQRVVQHLPKSVRPVVWNLDISLRRTPPDKLTGPDNGVRTPPDTGDRTPRTTVSDKPSLEPPNRTTHTPCSPPAGDTTKGPKPRRRLADDWEPRPDVIQQMTNECPSVDQDHELLQFRDHFIANAQTSTDWNLNYRKWIRNQAKWGAGRRKRPIQVENTTEAWLTRQGDDTPDFSFIDADFTEQRELGA